MRTSDQLYHQVRWDPRFDPARFVVGVSRRGTTPGRIPLPAFVPGGDIPWHRVLFVEADGEVVWDRATGVDRIDTTDAGRVRHTRLLRAPYFTACTAYAYDGHDWVPAQAVAAPTLPATLRVLTWNTLWDRYDSDRVHTAARRPLLLAALEESDADLVALQEVERELLTMLLNAPWVRASYTLGGDPDGRGVDDDGLLLLSRLRVREAGRHSLGPHKAVTALTVETATGPLVVAATHLSSDHSPDGVARRRAELASLAEGLSGVDAELILLGDLNDGAGGDGGPAAALGLRDAWSEVYGSEDSTPTFDPVANPLAAVASLSGRAARLDRVLLRGSGAVTGAVLRGDTPDDATGLHISDHYGVEVNLRVGEAGSSQDVLDALDVAATARTAVAWIPPRELWPPLQAVRHEHDPQIDRWPPHVNLLFGFVPESDFERAAPLVAAAAAGTAPFAVRLAGVHTFGHREDATLSLDPAASGGDGDGWTGLREVLERRFPRCGGRRVEGFTPHLTLGRSRNPQRDAAAVETRVGELISTVGELALLSRRGDEPMRVRATVALGTGGIRWTEEEGPSACPETVDSDDLARLLARTLPEGAVHVVGSRRMGCAPAGADLDLVAALPGAVVDMDEIRGRVAAALPAGASAVREVLGARVPGLRFAVGELGVDLAVVATGDLDPASAVERRAELGGPAAVALSAVSDAAAVRDAVGDRHDAFARLARDVKTWARARGLDSAPFGGTPGPAWAVLAARTVADGGSLDHGELLRDFFGSWAAWDWRIQVGLADGAASTTAPVTVLTPTAPVRSCTEQVGPGQRDLLVRELYRAWELLEDTGALVSVPPPLHRRHAAWAVVTVNTRRPDTLGRFRGRVRALLTALEAAGARDAHAWPRPFATDAHSVRYAIGLGADPPDAATLAGIVEPWGRGLRDVDVAWAAGGDVPTQS
ncbi:RNA repair domain-containing protein [Streptomyces sp. NBC_01498]|uniref:RNA repair domain-containing protein n=1 Tax=Streptomyces sp. NBC_01498 TaxID=2975870 RepID=UPI002E7C0261|nr:RNA repair domain-containing protein [Streptomyces sp. NBC_01498]WTL25190.1 RNA repair domain-containing protein [Streptomyces sp. NBC_01498]